ncbi:MAG: SLC13 family permease [Actinomycetota bacterium]
MTGDEWLTLAVLVVTFLVLVLDRVPTAAGLGGAVFALMLLGVVDQEQALTGLSASAPVTIAALYVLAGAATATGAFSPVIDRLMDAGGRGDRARLAGIATAAAGFSAVLPNTPLVALAAPRIVTWSRRTGRSPAAYLMPLSFAAVLGGVITVIGTSTNLVVSDLLVAAGDDPLGVFEITGAGLPVAIVGIAVLVVTAPRLRAARRPVEELDERAQRYTMALRVDGDGSVVGQTVDEAGLRDLAGVFLAGIERDGRVVTARPETRLGAGDVCYFVGDVDDIVDLMEVRGLSSAEGPHLDGALERPGTGLFEVVVSERSELAGSTLRDVGFRARYDAAVLAIRRHDDDVPGKLGTVELRPGDVLLLLATADFGRRFRGHSDFSVVAPLSTAPPPRRGSAAVVLAAIVAMVVLAVSGALTLLEASLLAVGAVVALRAVSLTEARRAVNLNVVLTIAMAISLGTAVAASGLAGEFAALLSSIGDPFGQTGRIVAVLVATMVLTEVLSNNAAAAVMLPVATATALDAGYDPRAFAIVALIGASCSFLSPLGYQTNLMVYGLGGYRFGDFTRVGAPLTLATVVVTPIVVPLFIGL